MFRDRSVSKINIIPVKLLLSNINCYGKYVGSNRSRAHVMSDLSRSILVVNTYWSSLDVAYTLKGIYRLIYSAKHILNPNFEATFRSADFEKRRNIQLKIGSSPTKAIAAVRLWNSIPDTIKGTRTRDHFKISPYRHYLSQVPGLS